MKITRKYLCIKSDSNWSTGEIYFRKGKIYSVFMKKVNNEKKYWIIGESNKPILIGSKKHTKDYINYYFSYKNLLRKDKLQKLNSISNEQ